MIQVLWIFKQIQTSVYSSVYIYLLTLLSETLIPTTQNIIYFTFAKWPAAQLVHSKQVLHRG